MATISHPTERDLLAFVQGNIDGTIATPIENHLSECPACCKRLGEFNEDYFVKMLKPVNSTLNKLYNTADVVNRLPTISGYEILREIGRGGMGVVYQARHLRLQRLVALKLVLGGNLASLNDLVRLRAEAAAAANLEHQNIIQIHEIGDFKGRPFLAMMRLVW